MKKRIVFIFIYLLLLFNIFSDNIKVSEKNKQTEVTQTSNGTDLINIANPNGQGVSYNDFDSFNVGQNGVIFNNSKQTGTSQTGGIVEKNTNLNNTANLVIGEVTGKDISKINGIIEMFGAQADLIIANSNGIVVNGAGFINIPKVMLTTGKYDKTTGKILAENGTVEISGNGIDVTKTNYFTILSRIIKLYGDIYGGTSEVNLIAGQNIYDTVNRSYESTSSAIGGAPSFAIDSTNLGGIYAGKINIVSSEKGVGVNSLGIVKASTGDFTLDSKGNIIINSVEAKKDVKISGESAKVTNIGAIGNTTIKVDETLETNTVNSGGNINIESSTYKNTKELVGAKVDINSKKIVNAGEIVAKNTLNVSSEELTLEKNSFLASTKGLTINSDKVTTNEDSKIYSNDFVKITSTILNNFGLIKGAGIDLIIENIVNSGKIISIGDKGNINITSSSITNSGNIAAQKNLYIKTLSLLNNKSGIIESGGDTSIYSDNLTNSGLFHSNGNINFYNNTTTESSITNYGTIEAIKNITFGKEDSKIGSIKNIGGKILAVENVNIYSENFENSPLKNIDIEYVNYNEDLSLKSGVINVVNIGYYALSLLGEINLPISTEEIKKINEKLKTKYTEITEELKKKYPDKIFIVTGIEVSSYSENYKDDKRVLSVKDTYIDENFINKKYTSAVVSGKNVNIDATKLKNTGSTIVADQNINIKDADSNIDVASINNDVKRIITLNKKEYTTSRDGDLGTIKFNLDGSVNFSFTIYEDGDFLRKLYKSNAKLSQDSTLERESNIGSIVAGQDLKINNNSINNVGEATTENASSGSTADYGSTDLDSYEDNTKDILLNTQITGIQYLYETRLEYVDLSYYYGSEYFFNKIGFDPTKDGATILLGDSYYEVKYIISQLEKLIGNGYTSAQIASEIEQVKALFDNAAELKGTLGLVIGQALTDEQKSKLTKDIVWLEQKEINGIKVLVPQVYLTTTTLKSISQGETEIYAGRNIEINGDKVNINGQISAGNKVLVKSKEIANSGGTIIGNAIGLYAEKDIVNTGETKIIAGETVVLDAKGNIKNTDGVISSGKDIGLYAGNDINLEGAYISAEGKVVLDAKNDVNIKTKVVTTKTENGENIHIVTKNESTYIEGENVLISSGNDTNVIGSVISAEKNLSISAENDINILAAKDSVYDKTVRTKRRWGRKKKTTTETYDESIVSSQLSAGDSLIFNAKNDIIIVGSTLENTEKEKKTTNEKGEEVTEKYVDGNISLKAEGDIGVYEGRELHEYNQTVEKKGFSFSFDIKKFELKAGIKIEKYIINTLQDLALYSSFDGGNILAKGNNITLQGVKINADSDVTLIAENDLVISDATDKYSSYSKTETTFIGVTLAVNPDLANVGNYFDRLKDSTGLLGGNSSDIINGVFGVTSGLRDLAGTVNTVTDTSANGKEIQGDAGVTEVMKTDKEDVRNLVTASIGATYSTEESYSQSETVVASEIKGKNINIKSGKDTTIEGSTIEATKNVTIEAENLNVLASKSTSVNTSDSNTASVTVGLDNFHFDPTSVTMAYSQSDSYNYTETYTNSKIKAGESVNVKVNNDMTVKGGVIEGDTANIYVGNDLKIESLQDIEKGNSSSYSGSVTLSIAQGGLPTDISYNQSKSETDKAWVTEQSGIYTKNGGAIKVEGKTDLKGSVIASESEENKLALDTKEFSYENIEDHDYQKTVGFGINQGFSATAKEKENPKDKTEYDLKTKAPATSVQYGKTDKLQETNATLSNVDLTVDGKKVDPNSLGINTDIEKAQVITKDEKIDLIDVELQTDLINKDERQELKDAKDKLKDYGETVVDTYNMLIGKNDLSLSENYKINRFITRALVKVGDDKELTAMLKELKSKDLTVNDKKNIIISLVNQMYTANGFKNNPDIKFEEVINGGAAAARGTETGTLYINLELISQMSPSEIIALLVHETTHGVKYGESSGDLLAEEKDAGSKEKRAEKEYKDNKKGISEDERKEYLTKLEKDYGDQRKEYDKLGVSSFDEPVENGLWGKIANKVLEFSGKGLKFGGKLLGGVGNLFTSSEELHGDLKQEYYLTKDEFIVKYPNLVTKEIKESDGIDPIQILSILSGGKKAIAMLAIDGIVYVVDNPEEAQKLLTYNNQGQKLLTYEGKVIKGENVKFTLKKLQHEYKHASDYGITGNWNNINKDAFENAIKNQMNSVKTPIIGTYRGNMEVYHFYDAKTGINTMIDKSGNFIGGWKLSVDQIGNLLRTGNVQ